MCGTKILNGTYVNEFSLLPFTGDFDNTDIHKEALTYNYPPIAHILKKGNGELKEFNTAALHCDNKAVILTALYPENGNITARFCNFSDESASAQFIPKTGSLTAETDLLGNELTPIVSDTLTFRPWEIKTVKITL